jgi:hypothetical protein
VPDSKDSPEITEFGGTVFFRKSIFEPCCKLILWSMTLRPRKVENFKYDGFYDTIQIRHFIQKISKNLDFEPSRSLGHVLRL